MWWPAHSQEQGRVTATSSPRDPPRNRRRYSQEQGPLAYHLLTTEPAAVRLVSWLQCEVRLGCSAAAMRASFAHYSGCGFSTKNARKCLHRYCAARPNTTVDAAASWSRPSGRVATHDRGRGERLRGASSVRAAEAAANEAQACARRPGCCERHPRVCSRPASSDGT